MKKIKAHILVSIICVSILLGLLFPGIGVTDSCEEWVAKVVSVQGNVQALRADETQWVPVKSNDTYSPNDKIRVQERSRAAVILCNEAVLRLDQNSTITFIGLEREKTLLLELIKGAAHFFSRIPQSLKLTTPFVNGIIEGTEFFATVNHDQTFLSIFEGRVVAKNEEGFLNLTSGQSAIAQMGQAPALHMVARPRDAVQWALYYPPVISYRVKDFPEGTGTDWQGMVRRSIQFYWDGDLVGAFSSLAGAPEGIRDPRFFIYRAGLLLSVGRVDEAEIDIREALKLDASNSHAFALQAIITMVQNRKDQSLELAEKAVALDPESVVARVALSYSLQAHFDLEGALKSLEEAVNLDPENALALARLAELWLSLGYLDKALDVAQKAVGQNPKLERTQTVLGFAYLTQIKTKDSRSAFEKAIVLDQAAPLPRLGLGLAKIRDGELKEGRKEIEISASLDPNNSLIRSYLGKAYFEEKRAKLDERQYKIAKELDPFDPTPWFYDAIRKQTVNRPVEALYDLQKSIELNDNRAVYRSRLLLDEDLAARSASLGRIYQDLGFEQLALVEGWKSINTDPANYSAHRFLADSYAALPRHEIARVSELLQSQLLQPININPVQPSLAESNLFILEGAGPSDPSFNEFNPLFNRNCLALQASGVAGDNDTRGAEVVQSGVWKRASYSIGGFQYQTDGFRENNDLEHDIYNVFAQGSLTHKTSLQAEYRYKDTENGDLPLRFNPDNFLPSLRQDEETEILRLGLHHAFSPDSDLIGSILYTHDDAISDVPPVLNIKTEEEGYMAEFQHIFRSKQFRITSGVGHYSADEDKTTMLNIFPPFPIPPVSSTTTESSDIRHTNLYAYPQINWPGKLIWTIGASIDFFEKPSFDRDQVNPKFGVIWNPIPNTTLRSAVFRVLKRTLISRQTIEPTQVAGFNQFFDDVSGTDSWRYGVGIDQKVSSTLFAGLEFSKRELEVPFTFLPTGEVRQTDQHEDIIRAYINCTPLSQIALTADYLYESFERPPETPGEESIVKVKTHHLPLGFMFFHPSGFSAYAKATYIDQKGDFVDAAGGIMPGEDHFWVFDTSIGYRLPKRYGLLTMEVKNLFDEDFQYQDMEFRNPVISPQRLLLAKITLLF